MSLEFADADAAADSMYDLVAGLRDMNSCSPIQQRRLHASIHLIALCPQFQA